MTVVDVTFEIIIIIKLILLNILNSTLLNCYTQGGAGDIEEISKGVPSTQPCLLVQGQHWYLVFEKIKISNRRN